MDTDIWTSGNVLICNIKLSICLLRKRAAFSVQENVGFCFDPDVQHPAMGASAWTVVLPPASSKVLLQVLTRAT